MWFKNILTYRLTESLSMPEAELEAALCEYRGLFLDASCSESIGWVSPFKKWQKKNPNTEPLPFLYSVGSHSFFCARWERKTLPSGALNEAVEARLHALEMARGGPINRQEQRAIKAELTEALRAQALSQVTYIWIWIDRSRNLLSVDSGSHSRAERVLALMRKTIGSLPIVPLWSVQATRLALTTFLKTTSLPEGLSFDEEVEFVAKGEEKCRIRYKHHPMECEAIPLHLQSGACVSQMAFLWEERLHFLMSDEGVMKRIKFRQQAMDALEDNTIALAPAEQFHRDALLMTDCVGSLLDCITPLLGGPIPELRT